MQPQYTTQTGQTVSERFTKALSAPQNSGSAQQIISTLNPVVPAVITSKDLAPTSSFAVPKTSPVPTAASAISGATDQIVETHRATESKLEQQLAQQEESARQAKQGSGSLIKDTYQRIFGVQSSRGEEEAKANVPQLGQYATEAINALERSKRAQQKEVEAVTKAPGATMLSIGRETDAINRRYASEQADLSINYDIANRNYSSAISLTITKSNYREQSKISCSFL